MFISLIETIRIFFKNLKEVINTISLLFYYPKCLQNEDVTNVAKLHQKLEAVHVVKD